MGAKNKPNEIYITRIYDASLKMVWEAWVDPKQVAQWWGPRGFTLTNHSKDVKTGGHWDYTMHGPDGVDWPNSTKYLEVEKYSKMVYDHGGYKDKPPMFRVTVFFTEINGKTKMDMTMALATAEAAKEAKKFIKQAGGDSTWDRLAEYLNEEGKRKDTFVINRTFEGPVDLVFDMFVNPKHIEVWLSPKGSSMEFFRSDIQVGKSTFYKMTNEHGTLYGRTQYLEIQKPNRLVYTQQFVDEKENLGKHPFAPVWPETMLTTVEFHPEENNLTRINLIWEPYGKVTPEEVAIFKSARGGMTMGWTGSFDKMEEYVATN